jgi:hypothetical protein
MNNVPMCQYANVPIGCAMANMPHGNWHIGILAHYSLAHYY